MGSEALTTHSLSTYYWQGEFEVKARPCPFCGSAELHVQADIGRYGLETQIFCNGCKAGFMYESDTLEEGTGKQSVEEAIAVWNRRTSAPQTVWYKRWW